MARLPAPHRRSPGSRFRLRLRAAVAAATLPLLSALAGCGTTAAPLVDVTEASVDEQDADATRFRFVLEIANEGREALPLDEFAYALAIEDRVVTEARHSAQATLPPGDRRRLELPVVVRHADLEPGGGRPRGTYSYVLSGSVSYVAPGELAEVLFDTRLRVPRAFYRQDGTITFGPSGVVGTEAAADPPPVDPAEAALPEVPVAPPAEEPEDRFPPPATGVSEGDRLVIEDDTLPLVDEVPGASDRP